jgi:phosphoglycerate dehydrogenase-like enzyme
MATGKVVLLSRGSLDKDSKEMMLSKMPAGWQVVQVNLNDDEGKVARELEDAVYIISSAGLVPQRLIERASKLKLIQSAGQDMGHLPVRYALEHNIYIANAGGTNAIAVAEFTVCAILNCMKLVFPYAEGLREGKWRIPVERKDRHELYGKTVGIIGFGNIGRRVARVVHDGFGANVIYHERFFVPYAVRADFSARPAGFEELLRESDVVTVHVPSFAANRKMIGAKQFSMMKPTAYLVNTSRGSNVDEEALLVALNEGKLAGAALDVWDPEPPDVKNPLLNHPRVVATPHIAGSTWENAAPAFETVWSNIVLVSEGKEPLNRIRDF